MKTLQKPVSEVQEAEEWMKNNPEAVEELGKNSLLENIKKSGEKVEATPEYTARPYGNKYLDARFVALQIADEFDQFGSAEFADTARNLRKAVKDCDELDRDAWYVRLRLLYYKFQMQNVDLANMLEIEEGKVFDKDAPQAGIVGSTPESRKSKESNYSPAEEQAEWERDKLIRKTHDYEMTLDGEFESDCRSLLGDLGVNTHIPRYMLPRVTMVLLIENRELAQAADTGNEQIVVADDEEGAEFATSGFKKVDIETAKRFWSYIKSGELNWFFRFTGKEVLPRYIASNKSLNFHRDLLVGAVGFHEFKRPDLTPGELGKAAELADNYLRVTVKY